MVVKKDKEVEKRERRGDGKSGGPLYKILQTKNYV
jgi:hypothetical protein